MIRFSPFLACLKVLYGVKFPVPISKPGSEMMS